MYSFWAKYKTLPEGPVSTEPVASTSQDTQNSATKVKKSNALLEEVYGSKSKRPRPAQPIDELEAYLAQEKEPLDTDPLVYWASKTSRWPRLCMMARDILAITATSASSERCFNAGTDLLGLNRHSLMPETMEASICVRSGLRSKLVNMRQFEDDA